MGGGIMKIQIDKIKIAERIRKEVTKVDELAANIRERGLITPIAVMDIGGGEYQLLAGLRRIRAMEMNGEAEIDAKVFPVFEAEDALKIEYSENEQREGFTFSEKMEYAAVIEEIEKAKARERQVEGGQRKLPLQGPEVNGRQKRETRSVVGEKIGISGKQYDRAKYITKNAPQEVIGELDRGERTIRGTYDELRATEHERASQPSDQPEVTSGYKNELRSIVGEKIGMTGTQYNRAKFIAANAPTEVLDEIDRGERSIGGTYDELRAKETGRVKRKHNKKDPRYLEALAKDAEYAAMRREFDDLPPEGKIEELQRQLRETKARAASAESDLSREKELRKNYEYHYKGTLEMMQRQLEEANQIIHELKAKYEPNSLG